MAACIVLSLAAGCGGGGSGGGGGGGYGGGGGGGGGGAKDCSVSPAMGHVIIDVNLGLASCNDTTYGLVQGYSTDNISSHVIKLVKGSTVTFTNTGNVAHTADDLGTGGFPGSDTNPLPGSPPAAGTDISTSKFSTGAIAVGASAPSSGSYNASVAGIYYFGCNFHYGLGMKTVIIVM
jgi:plastocyanin